MKCVELTAEVRLMEQIYKVRRTYCRSETALWSKFIKPVELTVEVKQTDGANL